MGKSDWMSIIIVYFGVQNVQSTPALWLGRIKFPPRLVRTDSNQEYSTTADIYVGIILSREFLCLKGFMVARRLTVFSLDLSVGRINVTAAE